MRTALALAALLAAVPQATEVPAAPPPVHVCVQIQERPDSTFVRVFHVPCGEVGEGSARVSEWRTWTPEPGCERRFVGDTETLRAASQVACPRDERRIGR